MPGRRSSEEGVPGAAIQKEHTCLRSPTPSPTTPPAAPRTCRRRPPPRVAQPRVSTETKASFKTTELIVYVVAVIGVLIASAMVDSSDFGAQEAWFYVSLLTIGYMISRGLAKSGSREPFDADVSHSNR